MFVLRYGSIRNLDDAGIWLCCSCNLSEYLIAARCYDDIFLYIPLFRNDAFSLLSGFMFHLYSIKSIRSYENTKWCETWNTWAWLFGTLRERINKQIQRRANTFCSQCSSVVTLKILSQKYRSLEKRSTNRLKISTDIIACTYSLEYTVIAVFRRFVRPNKHPL